MKKQAYLLKFNGRPVGAIGTVSSYSKSFIAKDESELMDKLYSEYEHISGLEISQLDGNTTTGLLAACGLDRDAYREGVKSYSVNVTHKRILLEHHDKLSYVMLYKREKGTSVNLWCYPEGFDHQEVFDTATGLRAKGKQVVIYKVLKSKTLPTLGALNVFCSWGEQDTIQRLLDVKCEFKVI